MLKGLKVRLRALLRKNEMERHLDEELSLHLERMVEQYVAQGMTPKDARSAALRDFGGFEQAKEECRDARGVRALEQVWQDLRYGARMLRKRPAFTLVAIITLALGIGANAAIFSVVYGVLLQPLPYAEDDRLVILMQSYPEKGLNTWGISQANFALYRDHNQSFEKIAAYNSPGFNLTGSADPERLQGAAVTADFFDVLGVQPAWGRAFRAEEDAPGKNSVCILSYGLWQRRFGGDPQILGQSLLLNDMPTEVVGIMPQGFAFPNRNVELWIPLGLDPKRTAGYTHRGIARLKPGVSVSQAEADTTTIFWNAARENPAIAAATAPPPEGADMKTIVRPLKEVIVGDTKTPLLVLLGAVGLVLLIACANVANLLLARAASRTRELALRFALGATPGRVIRQLLTESLLLSLIGGADGCGTRVVRRAAAGAVASTPTSTSPGGGERQPDGAGFYRRAGGIDRLALRISAGTARLPDRVTGRDARRYARQRKPHRSAAEQRAGRGAVRALPRVAHWGRPTAQKLSAPDLGQSRLSA